MGWNPFDIGQTTDPKRNAWLKSGPYLRESERISAERGEVFRTIAVPGVCLFATLVATRGSRDLEVFWNSHPGWALTLQAVAIMSAVAALVLLGLIAVRRYSRNGSDGSMPPIWFRLVLAAMELGQIAALMTAAIVKILNVDAYWPDAVLICVIATIGLVIGQRVLRWRAEPFGWVTGRIFHGRFG